MVHMQGAGKTVRSHCYIRALSEHFRDKRLIIKRYINSSVYFNLLLHLRDSEVTLPELPAAQHATVLLRVAATSNCCLRNELAMQCVS